MNSEQDDITLYRFVLKQIEVDDQTCERKVTPKIKDEISKDLNRTKTSARVQTQEGQQELERVLQALAYCFPEVGYCQGMNFIASVLIAVTESEEQGFLIFCYLLVCKEMKPMFLTGLPELHLKNFQMAQLIKFHMPKFFNHLRKI